MGELKPGWRRVKFGEVVRLNRETCKDAAGEGIERFIGLEHLEPGDLRVRSWGEVSDGTTFTNRVRPGQVLFGKRRAYQRKIAVADFDAVCSGDIYVFESANPEVLLPELLAFICQTEAFFEHAVETSAGSLSPRTNWSSLANYQFVLPSLEEQRRVAAVLVAANSASNAYREVFASAQASKSSLLGEVLPRLGGARMIRLADAARVVRGSTPRPAGDPRYFGGSFIPWLTVGEVTRAQGMYLTNTETMLTEAGARLSRLIPAGTVVLTNSGFSLGVPGILAMDACANDGVAAFLELDESLLLPPFLYYCLVGLTEYFRVGVAAGGDQPNLNTARIGAVQVPCPDLSQQREFVGLVSSLEANAAAARQRQILVQRVSVRLLSSMMQGA